MQDESELGEDGSKADQAAWPTQTRPAMDQFIQRRYLQLENPFLNWDGEGEEDVAEEEPTYRHTFSAFGQGDIKTSGYSFQGAGMDLQGMLTTTPGPMEGQFGPHEEAVSPSRYRKSAGIMNRDAYRQQNSFCSTLSPFTDAEDNTHRQRQRQMDAFHGTSFASTLSNFTDGEGEAFKDGVSPASGLAQALPHPGMILSGTAVGADAGKVGGLSPDIALYAAAMQGVDASQMRDPNSAEEVLRRMYAPAAAGLAQPRPYFMQSPMMPMPGVPGQQFGTPPTGAGSPAFNQALQQMQAAQMAMAAQISQTAQMAQMAQVAQVAHAQAAHAQAAQVAAANAQRASWPGRESTQGGPVFTLPLANVLDSQTLPNADQSPSSPPQAPLPTLGQTMPLGLPGLAGFPTAGTGSWPPNLLAAMQQDQAGRVRAGLLTTGLGKGGSPQTETPRMSGMNSAAPGASTPTGPLSEVTDSEMGSPSSTVPVGGAMGTLQGRLNARSSARAGADKTAMWEGVTTLMVRNIPVRYTQEMLLREWPNNSTYDFLYLPVAANRKRNVSFAFVNFISSESALAFRTRWHKQRLVHFNTQKPLDISPADIQGRDDNILQVVRQKTFRIRNKYFLPAVFDPATGARIHIDDIIKSLNLRPR
uniref:Mei2-like C-terminal RNA recognition motif domain-containing protein n=1 Tax=Noctiluca scintillans TaxID=2966 RepID=A0A7S1AC06_NOCSC